MNIDYGSWDCKQQRVPLKTPNNQDATQSLFYEFDTSAKDDAVYTLKNEDRDYNGKLRVSAYQVYMHSTDEYEAAIKLVGSMKHWRKLCSLKWFMKGDPQHSFEGLESWREDMRMRDESLAKKLLLQNAQDGNVTAQKVLFGDKKAPPKTETKTKKEQPKEYDSMVASFNRAQGLKNG